MATTEIIEISSTAMTAMTEEMSTVTTKDAD